MKTKAIPRRSRAIVRLGRAGGNPPVPTVIPASAGMTEIHDARLMGLLYSPHVQFNQGGTFDFEAVEDTAEDSGFFGDDSDEFLCEG